MVGAAHGLHHRQLHTGKEHCSCWSAMSPRPGPSHGVVSSSLGVDSIHSQFFLLPGQMWNFLCMSSQLWIQWRGSMTPSSIDWTISAFVPFLPFALLRQVLSRVMLLTEPYMILVAPLCPQKEWFTGLLALVVEKPLELPMVWESVGSTSCHRGLESLRIHSWSL